MSLYEKTALQLWGIYGEADNDIVGTMKKLKDRGISGIEPFQYPQMTSAEFGKVLADLDMGVPSIHLPLDKLLDGYREYCEYFLPLGLKYLVMPGYHVHDEKEYVWFTETFSKLARDIKSEGAELLYHNHTAEFTEIVKDGKPYWISMAEECSDINFQLDCYWSQVGGYAPLAMLEKYPDRIRLLHIKNGHGEHASCDIDKGIIDFEPVLALAHKLGHEWSILEYEDNDDTYDFCERAVGYIKGLKK